MRTNWILSLGLVSLTLSVLAFAAPAKTGSTATTVGPTPVPTATTATPVFTGVYPIGSIDVRPSYYPDPGLKGKDGIGTENTVQLGAQLSQNVQMSWFQSFNSNLYNANEGKDFTVQPSYLDTRVTNLWTSANKSWTLSFENRIYLPIVPAERDAGQVLTMRNYLNLTKKFSDRLSVTASLVPIVFVFDRSGNGVGAAAKANPAFENRVYLIPTITLAPKLTLTVPLFFHQSLSRTYLGKRDWTFTLWTWPELDYAIDAHQTIGIAYYSDPYTTAVPSKRFEFKGGGALQLVYHATL